jgi:hypothetical protein
VRLFDRVVFVDWSAAATRGPRRPSRDRCWVAWGGADGRPKPQYCRTRHEAIDVVRRLLVECRGDALVGFDFPYGFPQSSGLGGGRKAAARLAALVTDDASGANNRFEVAAALNAELNDGRPGPFWGCPRSREAPTLTAKAPAPDAVARFRPFRIVEERLRRLGKMVQSDWKLAYPASVGSQTLLGLPAIHRLVSDPALAARSRIWPFETGWDSDLSGIIHAEIWPSVLDWRAHQRPDEIRDEAQVRVLRDWALDRDEDGALRRYLARPAELSSEEEAICRATEGWILGVR